MPNDYEVDFIELDDGESLKHYGTPRHSGRYPWGSGKNPQRHGSFASKVRELKSQGISEKDIAKSFNMTTTQLRSKIAADSAAEKKSRDNLIFRLKEKGMSNMAISRRTGLPESTIRGVLKEQTQMRSSLLQNTADALKESVERDKYVDVGKGVEKYLGVTQDKLKKATGMLQEEGYVVENMRVKQASTGNYTELRVLAMPGTTRKELMDNLTEIKLPFEYTQDGGLTFYKKEPIQNIDSSRVYIRYAEEGGIDKDGVIEIRRGVEDLNLGNARYAQVRIGVDGESYLKGMAMYGDIPKGYDVVFNTNKKKGTPAEKVFKPQDLSDPYNPFGASLKEEEQLNLIQRHYVGKDGKEHLSALNIVNEEGSWGEWKKTLAAQFLSKQDPQLAKKQLKLDGDIRRAEFDEIMSLTNPVVKKQLLESFADECDSAAVHLAAAALPRQRSHVILPVPELKQNEIYAPNYNNGEEVVLVRYPHGGIFEIPRLIVNNKNQTAKELLGNAKDAVGINPKAAQQLSGADFDGDSVLVIPTKGIHIRTKDPYQELQDFSTDEYIISIEPGSKTYNGHKVYTNKQGRPTLAPDGSCGNEMGKISNLITDMTIKGASDEELVRAVKHSMVIIDAYKHGLDYYRSAEDNNIAELKKKYQAGGASTIISQAKGQKYVDKRKSYYKINPETGEKIFEETGDLIWKKKVDKRTGEETWESSPAKTKSTKMYEAKDAYELSSGTVIESVYADYANEMKRLGDRARLESTRVPSMKTTPGAKETYKSEVDSLMSKLAIAQKNAPIERQAQLLAQKKISLKLESNPDMDKDELKKVRNQAIAESRTQVGAKKVLVNPTDKEWEAIQAGAISKTKLEEIIKNSDETRIKELSTPKDKKTLSESYETKIRQLERQGYTTAQIADRLGVSTSLVNDVL